MTLDIAALNKANQALSAATSAASASPTQSNPVIRYVSPAGDDALNGQVDRKMRTIAAALASMAGQSSADVECDPGTYAETLTFGTAHSRRTIRGVKGGQRVVISREWTISEACQQCYFQDLKFDNTTGYALNITSSLSNFVIDGLNIGGNFANPIAINVASGGSGFITIVNCDLSNKVVNLANTVTPRYCFVGNCANFFLNAGTGWIVVKTGANPNVNEVTRNSNVIDGVIANAALADAAAYNAVITAGSAGNGYYLCQYTSAGLFQAGDIILRQHPATVVAYQYYNAPPAVHLLSNNSVALKFGGLWRTLDPNATAVTASNGLQKVASDIQGINASTAAKGVVQLSNLTAGTSQTLAATEKAVSDSLTEAKAYADSGLATKVNASAVGAVDGVASLDGTGRVPSAQLPSYVDDVLEFADLASFPATGEAGKIYIALDSNLVYRWAGSVYAVMSGSLALGETSTTAYRGDRGKIAYDHSQVVTGNPHSVTKYEVGLGEVDNTSDADKPISTAAAIALALKSDKSNVLELDRTSSYTPFGDYHPATKKYVDDAVAAGGGGASLERNFTAAENLSQGAIVRITASGEVESIARVATGSGTAIDSWGPLDKAGTDYVEATYNSIISFAVGEKVVQAWSIGTGVRIAVGIRSGDSVAWGEAVTVPSSASTPYPVAHCEVQSDVFVLSMQAISGLNYQIAARITGTALTFGAAVNNGSFFGLRMAPINSNVFLTAYSNTYNASNGTHYFATRSVNLATLAISSNITSTTATFAPVPVNNIANLLRVSESRFIHCASASGSSATIRVVSINPVNYAITLNTATSGFLSSGSACDAVFLNPAKTKIAMMAFGSSTFAARILNVSDIGFSAAGAQANFALTNIIWYSAQAVSENVVVVLVANNVYQLFSWVLDCSGTVPVAVSGPTQVMTSYYPQSSTTQLSFSRAFTPNDTWPDGHVLLPIIYTLDNRAPYSQVALMGDAVSVYPADAAGIVKSGAVQGGTATIVTLGGTFAGGAYTPGSVEYIDPLTGAVTEIVSAYPIGRAVSATELLLTDFGPVSAGPVTINTDARHFIESSDGQTVVTADRTGSSEGKIAFRLGGQQKFLMDTAAADFDTVVVVGYDASLQPGGIRHNPTTGKFEFCEKNTGTGLYEWVEK